MAELVVMGEECGLNGSNNDLFMKALLFLHTPLQPGTWKLRKKRESLHGEGAKTSKNRDVYRSKSNKESKEG